MNSNPITKQCLIIGSFSVALCSVGIFMKSIELWYNFHTDFSETNRSIYVTENLIHLSIYGAAAIICILLICGIRKRSLLLMAPWMLCAFVVVALSIYIMLGTLLSILFMQVEFLLTAVATVGVETLILYPLCYLMREIYQERSEKKKRQQTSPSNYDNNTKICFENLSTKSC